MARHLPIRVLLLVAMLGGSPGCLVLSLIPVYDEASIGWDPGLLGQWIDPDDKASLTIERSEWKSYRIHYVHPIETGDLTGYLTIVGDERYLDLMPARGEDRGSFLIPVHAVLRIRVQGDRLELTPSSYDWFVDHRREARTISGLDAVSDQKENALIVSPAVKFRDWLRAQPIDGPMFGAPATFMRKDR
jgi:hypothetical protein